MITSWVAMPWDDEMSREDLLVVQLRQHERCSEDLELTLDKIKEASLVIRRSLTKHIVYVRRGLKKGIGELSITIVWPTNIVQSLNWVEPRWMEMPNCFTTIKQFGSSLSGTVVDSYLKLASSLKELYLLIT